MYKESLKKKITDVNPSVHAGLFYSFANVSMQMGDEFKKVSNYLLKSL